MVPRALIVQRPTLLRRAQTGGIPECGKGMLVPAVQGGAALFYHKLPNGANDPRSSHAGCPPVAMDKWAINSFMWNVPYSEGLAVLRT